MRKKTLTNCIVGALALVMIVAFCGFAQENVTSVRDSAFQKHMRSPVRFAHDAHNEKAKIDECQVCHHVYENGKKAETSSSEDRKCSECHLGKSGDSMSLIKAYHTRCKGCHADRKAGPVMCAECHQNKGS